MTRPRRAIWIAVPVGLLMALLVAVLATRDPASSRLAESPLLGKMVPPLVGRAVSGETFDIDDRRGRWVLVNFFATWCGPCIEEHDDLVRFERSFVGEAEIVSVVYSDGPRAVEQFFAERGGNWPVVPDDDAAISTSFGVTNMPESFLVAPNGTVVGKVTGGVTFDFLRDELARRGVPLPT